MRIVFPKQHGAWAMLSIPFLLGVFKGEPVWSHILLFLAWVFLYVSSYLLSLVMKGKKTRYYWKWFFIYAIPALLLLIYPIFYNIRIILFGVAMVPFFLTTLYYSKIKKDRALINDIVAIIIFCIGALTSYYYSTATLDRTAWLIFLYNFLYFLGTVFYVKTMIRERKNIRYKYVSWSYHIGLVLIFAIIGKFLTALAYLPAMVRALVLYGKNPRIKIIGINEIASSLFFFITMLFAL